MRLVKWKCPCSFAFSDGEQHSETDMQMKLSHNNKLHPCHRLHTREFFFSTWRHSVLKHVITESKYLCSYLMYIWKRKVCNLNHLWLGCFLGFLQWWSAWFFIPVCSFSILKILHCPPMFIWMTFCPITASSQLYWAAARDGGGSCQEEAGHANHASPTFYRLSYKLLMYLVCLSEQTMCRHTAKGAPFLPCLHLKHTTSSLLPPPLAPWFTSSFATSVTFYGVHTFFFFFLLSAQSRPAWRSQKRSR